MAAQTPDGAAIMTDAQPSSRAAEFPVAVFSFSGPAPPLVRAATLQPCHRPLRYRYAMCPEPGVAALQRTDGVMGKSVRLRLPFVILPPNSQYVLFAIVNPRRPRKATR